ncbi:MAG: flagellar hook capping FlgD N-terminal domain-containing protein [Rhodoferax sp.]
MTTAINPVSSASSLTGTPAPANTALSDANASQDRFLKLLVAQLNNQDPMNPMDNAQMTTQMAQISTVSGIQQLNETMKSMSTQFSSMQVTQSASLIGHGAMVQSNTLSVDAGKALGAVDLGSDASSVKVQVLSPGGQLLDTLDLGALAAGRHSFQWDASNYTETASPTFKVVAANGTNAVTSTALAQDTITSIGSTNGSMTVQFKGRAAVAYSDIQAIL